MHVHRHINYEQVLCAYSYFDVHVPCQVGMLDVLLFNVDRHEGNMLLKQNDTG
jgi:hypothetical protein